jgi:hypothetical protein
MENNTNTPETDSYANRDWWTLFRANEHARQLERERDEAREKYTALLTENMFAVHNLHKQIDNAVAVADELAEIASLCLGQTLSSIKSNTDENNLKQADKITRALEQWKKLKKIMKLEEKK